jgi:hypothetical protein
MFGENSALIWLLNFEIDYNKRLLILTMNTLHRCIIATSKKFQTNLHMGNTMEKNYNSKKGMDIILLNLFFRVNRTLFGGVCKLCDCNGHAATCDPMTLECDVIFCHLLPELQLH